MIVKWWRAYIAWCDRMGLTPENQRCCAPKLSEPELRGSELSEPELNEPELNEHELNEPALTAHQAEIPQQAPHDAKARVEDARR